MTTLRTHDTTTEFSDTTPQTTTTEWERDSENTPVFAVISAVAEASGTDLLELPPLHDVIDAEALNTLFTARPTTTIEKVTFQYAGYDVVVRGTGEVQIRPTPTV